MVGVFSRILFITIPQNITFCCGHQRRVVQCIELLLQVPQVGFCAGEHNMQST